MSVIDSIFGKAAIMILELVSYGLNVVQGRRMWFSMVAEHLAGL
jgi:hypothetical protein